MGLNKDSRDHGNISMYVYKNRERKKIKKEIFPQRIATVSYTEEREYKIEMMFKPNYTITMVITYRFNDLFRSDFYFLILLTGTGQLILHRQKYPYQ